MYSKDGGYYSSSNKKIYPKPHIGPASSSTTRPNQYDKGTTKTKKKVKYIFENFFNVLSNHSFGPEFHRFFVIEYWAPPTNGKFFFNC